MTLLYLGPGLGVGSLILIGLVLLLIVAALGVVLWLPLKRAWQRLRGRKADPSADNNRP